MVSTAEYYLQGTYTRQVLTNFWDLFTQLWYFAALGALVSALIWRCLPKARFRRLLQNRVGSSIIAASVLGMVSPMCTFAAIPIVRTLIAQGVPAAPLMAFAISSPLMNPALFIYTAGIIDVEMAVARTLTACSIGLVAGFGTLRLQRRMPDLFQVDLARPSEMPYPAVAGGSAQPWSMEITQFARRFWTDLSFIGKYFTLGLLIAALVKSLLSEEWIVHILGDASHWSVPAAVALGVPLYACGGGSIPVIDSMMQMGMTRGAALAFFISGPATKFSTLSVFGTVFGSRLLGLYLAVMLVGALIWGWVYPFSGGPLLPNWN